MTLADPVILSGAPGSPYTRKMLAVLRYRRIAYRFIIGNNGGVPGLPRPKVALLPTFYLPDATGTLEAVTDSTPLIRRFEQDYSGRSIVPSNPALAFIDALIEDYADEWLTKAMFHYRWAFADDVAKAGAILPCWRGFSIPDEDLAKASDFISDRQIGRLRYVGSNAITGPAIEASYCRFLEAFEDHLRQYPYLLGHRPSACDFGIYGQLTQLAEFDPTPMSLTLKLAPRVTAWTGILDDQSGVEITDKAWFDPDALPPTLLAILSEIGRVYTPVMLANATAVVSGATEVTAEVDGLAWSQQPFPYQAKCLRALREDYAALPASARAQVDKALAGTGCEPLFT